MTDDWSIRAAQFLHSVQMGGAGLGVNLGGVAALSKSMPMGAMPSTMPHPPVSSALQGEASGNPMLSMLMKKPGDVEMETMGPIDPDVQELCDHFNIEERHVVKLGELMKSRQDTFEGDMLKLWEELERARVPNGMLVVTMREMENGRFIGKGTHKDLNDLCERHKLDETATSKLGDILARYEEDRRQEYMREVDRHLEVSSRPSAMVMMLLKKLGNGESLGKPGAPAPGSLADREAKKKSGDASERGDRDRSDRGRDRDRGDRDRDRERDRGDRGDRERSRSRSRHRR